MKLRNLFICIGLMLAIASCKKDLQNPHTLPIDTVVVQQPVPYTVVENFENGSKRPMPLQTFS